MKICYINYLSPSIIHGGAERVVFEEAKMMVDSGNEVLIVSLKHTKNIPNILYLYDGKIKNLFLPYVAPIPRSALGKGLSILSSFYNPMPIAYLVKLLTREQPDIVHIHQLGPISFYALKTIKRLGFKIVQTFHGYYFECPKGSLFKRSGRLCNNPPIYCRLYKKAYYNLMSSCDHIVAISSYVKQRLLNADYNPDVITLMSNSISTRPSELSTVKPKLRKEVLFVGRMVKAKGVHTFLRALTKIRGIGERYIVNLVGDGEDKMLFEELAKSFSINVNFLGKVSDEVLEQYYKRAWVVIIPSIFPESSSMVSLEAALYGCPVIASNIGGIRDLVLHGHTGFLFNPGDADELANYLETLLVDEQTAMKMGDKARHFVRNFSSERKLKQLLQIYDKVLCQ
jgi:glycosyltransferase involved in cell wall biosynthesis